MYLESDNVQSLSVMLLYLTPSSLPAEFLSESETETELQSTARLDILDILYCDSEGWPVTGQSVI